MAFIQHLFDGGKIKDVVRVALINNFPSYSGTGRVAYELFHAFQRLHLSIDLYCTHYLRREDLNLPENRDVRFLHGFPYKEHENLSRLLIYFCDPFRIPRQYNLYHLSNHMLGNYLYFLQPAVVTVHDLLQFKYQEERGDSLSSKIYNALLQISLMALPRAKRIICVSDWTRREVLQRFNLAEDKVVTIYNGINHQLFKPGDKKRARQELSLPLDSKVLLHVGAETKRKNIPTLLQALSELVKEEPTALLVRVGERTGEMARLLRERGLGEKVKYCENVPENHLPLYYQAADVLVLPSFAEGFGFPVLEALACGTPVVCSRVGPLPEIGGGAAVYADPTSVADLAEKILSVLHDDTGQYQSRVQAGLAQAEKFSWEKVATETLAVYESLGV